MNKELTTLLTRMVSMINGLLAITYLAFFTWIGVELFQMIF
jgi:hypothetical protein